MLSKSFLPALGLLFALPPCLLGQSLPTVVERDQQELLNIQVDLMFIADTGTEVIESKRDFLIPGEGRSHRKVYTLGLGEGRLALLDVTMDWTPADKMGDAVLLEVSSDTKLSSAIGFSSEGVGRHVVRRENLQLQPGQDHLLELWVSPELRARLLATFRLGRRVERRPTLESDLDPVTFRISAYEEKGWRKAPLQAQDMRSLGGKEVGFLYQLLTPVRLREGSQARERVAVADTPPYVEDDSETELADGPQPEESRDRNQPKMRVIERTGDEEWTERNLSEPIRMSKSSPKKKKKEDRKRKQRIEEKELTDRDIAVIEGERKAREAIKMQVERIDLRLQPVFTGDRVLRARMNLQVQLWYPTLDREANVQLEKFLDFEHADILTLDLLELAGVDPSGFPRRYAVDVKAIW